MSKQDGCLPRTASDLERKFGFSQTFKELSMLISEAETSARRANEAYAAVDQKHIIYLLTNGGQTKGIYLDDKGNVLFNATYIMSGEVGDNRIPTSIARVSQIPTLLSQLENDKKFLDEAGVQTVVLAMELTVKAENVDGQLSYGQLPSGVALSSEIPKATSELANDSGFITEAEATTAANNAISASTVISGQAQRIAALEAKVQTLETTVSGLSTTIADLTARLEALEGASTT